MEKDLHRFDEEIRNVVENHRENPDGASWSAIEQRLDQAELASSKRKQKKLKRYLLLLLFLTISLSSLLVNEWGREQSGGIKQSADGAVSADKIASGTRGDANEQQQTNANTQNIPSTAEEKLAESKSELTSEPNSTESVSTEKYAGSNTTTGREIAEVKKNATENEFDGGKTEISVDLKKLNNTIAKLDHDEKLKSFITKNSAFAKSPARNKTRRPVTQVGEKFAVDPSLTHPDRSIASNVADLTTLGSSEKNEVVTASTEESARLLQVPKERSGWHFPSYINKMEKLADQLNAASPVFSRGKKRFDYPQLSVIPFYSYEQGDQELEEGRREHREDDRDEIEKGEESSPIAQKGLMANWQLQKNWGLVVGLSQSGNNTKIRPREIYARPDQGSNNELRYKVSCSAGAGYITAKSGATTPVFGDSLRALESIATLRYVSVPLAGRYSIHINKATLSILAGTQVNFLAKKQLSVNYWETTGAKNQTQVRLQGPKAVYLSGLFGATAEYAIRPRVRLFLMPTQLFSLGSINRNSPTRTRQSTTGLRLGVSVGLK